jgi:23S rRNA (cytosine1962-C5)-methyltransferase
MNFEKSCKAKGKFENGEIGLPMTNSKLVLPCGIYGRWES